MTHHWQYDTDEDIIVRIRDVLQQVGYTSSKQPLDWELLAKGYKLPSKVYLATRFGMSLKQFVNERVLQSDEVLLSSMTNEDILAMMRDDTKGKYVRATDWQGPISVGAIQYRFGSWKKACEQAGLSDIPEVWTKGKIIARIQAQPHFLTRDDWREKQLTPSVSTIEKKMGGWNQAWRQAGCLDVPENADNTGFTLSDDEILDAIRHIYDQHGYVTADWWEQRHLIPSKGTIRARFHGWERAWELATGISGRGEYGDQQRENEMIDTMKQIGCFINTREWQEGNYTPTVHWIMTHYAWKAAWAKAGISTTRFPNPANYTNYFERLSPKAKEILGLRYQGKTYQAIADHIHVTRQYAHAVCQQFEQMSRAVLHTGSEE